VDHYNNVRLNSATGYVTPKDMLAGRQQEIHAERDWKLEAAPAGRLTFSSCPLGVGSASDGFIQSHVAAECGVSTSFDDDPDIIARSACKTIANPSQSLCQPAFACTDDKNFSRKTHPMVSRVLTKSFERLALHFGQLLH
jgi:hypothetical protein